MTTRLAFITSDQHFIQHGGIGTFASGIARIAKKQGWFIDIIIDRDPRDRELAGNPNFSRIVHPQTTVNYSDHSSAFYRGESLNAEKIINFRNALLLAHRACTYDVLIANNPEAALAAYSMGFPSWMPVVFYTHYENAIYRDAPTTKTFKPEYDDLVRSLFKLPGLIVGTQCTATQRAIHSDNASQEPIVLPMPLAEQGLQRKGPPFSQRSGVLFTGRHEDRKAPDQFAKAVAAANLPAKVMTGGRQAEEKWKATFRKYGVSSFDIKVGLKGRAKTDFIKSARVAFHPAKTECYPYAVLEALHSCPVVLDDERYWSAAFKAYAVMTTTHDASKTLKSLHQSWTGLGERKPDVIRSALTRLEGQTIQAWQQLMKQEHPQSQARNGKFIDFANEGETFSMLDFIISGLKRDLCLTDISTIMRSRHRFTVTQDSSRTTFRKLG